MTADCKNVRSELVVPRVSVLIPVYNSERFLEETLRSACDQSVRDIEIVVVDDGSTDHSREIVNRYAASDPRIRLVIKPHSGIADTLNAGIEASLAPWIARLDSDDLAHPERLARQLDLVRQYSDVRAVGSHCWIIGEGGVRAGQHAFGPTTPDEYSKVPENAPMYLLSPTVMFHKATVQSLGGYRPAYEPGEDIDLWTRIADDHLILVIPEPLASYRIHSTSISSANFGLQMRIGRLIGHNTALRRQGLGEIELDDFVAIESSHPAAQRLQRHLSIASHRRYRRGAATLASGGPSGAIDLLLSFATYPPTILSRIARQQPWRHTRALGTVLTSRVAEPPRGTHDH